MASKGRSEKERRRKERAQARKARDAKRNVRAPERTAALHRALESGLAEDWAYYMSVNGDNTLFPVPAHFNSVLECLADEDMQLIATLAATYSGATDDGANTLLAIETDAAGIDGLDVTILTPNHLADGPDPFLYVSGEQDEEVIRAVLMWLPSIDTAVLTPLVVAGNAHGYGVWVIDEGGTWLPCTAPVKYWGRLLVSGKWRFLDKPVRDAVRLLLPMLGAPAEVIQTFALVEEIPGYDKPNGYQHPAVARAFEVTQAIAQDHLDVAVDLAGQLVRERAMSADIMDYAAGYRTHVESTQPGLSDLQQSLQAAKAEAEQLRSERDALAEQLRCALAQTEELRSRPTPAAASRDEPVSMRERLAALFETA